MRIAPKTVRAAALAHYGGHCDWCHATESLEFDHIHDDGAAHRRQLGKMPLEVWLQANGYPAGIVRLLCRPCHELRTRGSVTPPTAGRRLIDVLTRRRDPMPPRHGATTVHITLAPDAVHQLDELAALDPNTSKSRIIEGLIRQASKSDNGHKTDLLLALEGRLDAATRNAEDLVQTLTSLTPTLATLKGTIDRLDRQQKEIIAVLTHVYDGQQQLHREAERPWWTMAYRWLRYGSASRTAP